MTTTMLWWAAVLLSGGAQDPAGQATDEEAKALLEEYKADLRQAKSEEEIGRTVAMLGRLRHPKILDELGRWLRRRSVGVAGVAANAIGKYEKDRKAAELLAASANGSREEAVVISCLRALGQVGYRPIVPKIARFIRHRDRVVAREAIDACARLRSGAAMDELLKLAKELDGIRDDPNAGFGAVEDERVARKRELERPCLEAMEFITGEKHPTVRDWDKWWRRHRRTFKDPEE